MKKYILLFIKILIIQQLLFGWENDAVKADVFMTKRHLQEAQMNINFIPAFVKTPSNFIFLSSKESLYLLGREGLVEVFDYFDVSSFALSARGELYFVQGDMLRKFDESTSALIDVIQLPNIKMRLSTGKEALYIYDAGKIPSADYAIYKLFSDGSYIKIIEVPTPINAVAEIENYLFFSTVNSLYIIDIGNEFVQEIATLENQNDRIISIAIDEVNDVLYFSGEYAIFRIQNDEIVCVNDQFGGLLQIDDFGLVIFNPAEQFVVRLRHTALFAEEEPVLNENRTFVMPTQRNH